jgi:hypothetical protein
MIAADAEADLGICFKSPRLHQNTHLSHQEQAKLSIGCAKHTGAANVDMWHDMITGCFRRTDCLSGVPPRSLQKLGSATGDSIMKEGVLNGYSGGNRMRP